MNLPMTAHHPKSGDAADLAALRRWREGDREAGAELLRRQKTLAAYYCARAGLRGTDAIVDVYQDAVLAALRELPTLPERVEKSFSGWFAWRVRAAISQRRRAERPTDALDRAAELAVAPAADPAASELADAIVRCREKLPPKERAVFGFRFQMGLSLRETAERVGGNENAVSQCVFRLSRRMRLCLSAAGFSAEGAA
jgi:RNA polymerase sigma factor (sigma-70 family)